MIKALIAVRSGSERVQNKNMRSFAGKSLLEHKIIQLKQLNYLDGIVVNSNDNYMLDIASKMGCETVKRSDYYASSHCCMSDVYVNLAENFSADTIVYTNVTNPLVENETIEQAIDIYFKNQGVYSSVNTAHLIKEFLYLNGKPLNYCLTQQPRSQDLPDIYALNFAVSVISRVDMIKFKNVIAPNHYLLAIPEQEALDIDSEFDFAVAEYIFNKTKIRQ